MFRREDHVGGAVECVGTGRVDSQYIIVGLAGEARLLAMLTPRIVLISLREMVPLAEREDYKVNLRPLAPPDPIPLQQLDAF
jgi:hypothetical protein